MTRSEAHALLFKGQANVAKTAKEVGCTTEDLMLTFRIYASAIPIDEDVWQGDVALSWPYA